jgi:hypothetical protein
MSRTKLIVAVSLLLAACAADHVDERNSRIGRGGGGGTGDGAGTGGPGGAGCSGILEIDCNPAEKQYTPKQIAECEASRDRSYDLCVAEAACGAVRDPAIKACYSPDGTKPAEGTPERGVFDACIDAAMAAYYACLPAGGGGTSPGGGTGP